MSQTTNSVQNWMDNHHHHSSHSHNHHHVPLVPIQASAPQSHGGTSSNSKYKSTITVIPLASPSPPQSIHSTSSELHPHQHPIMTIEPPPLITPPPRPSKKGEVRLNSMPWFHGKITRERAEELLVPREDGLFLVRESTNFPGDYTLCVVWNGRVEHYRVIYKDNQLTIDEEEFFENLSHLVEHYEKDADGLCTRLTKPLPKEGSQEYCVDAKAFIDAGWVISSKEIELQDSLGKGEFGEVRLGLLRGSEQVAVKILKDSSKAAQAFLAEASLMTSLRHENLVKLLGVVFEGRNINLVTEYLSKGSLLEYLRSRGRLHVTKGDQINFAFDTCAGMEYLEKRRVVHRDLAARNVLIAEDGTAKVADFGLAWREEGIMTSESSTGKLPIKWTAPEALKKNRFSNKSDMWSFGVLLWEIYSFGRVPYPRVTLSDVLSKVERGYIMDSPDGCPSQIYDLMKSSWKLNPDDRPSFSEVKTTLSRLRYKFTTALT